jgi:hypothetical protein
MNCLYNIVQAVEGTLVSTHPTDILAWAEINDREVYGYNFNRHNRSELQGQPKISGLLGPMYDAETLVSLLTARLKSITRSTNGD